MSKDDHVAKSENREAAARLRGRKRNSGTRLATPHTRMVRVHAWDLAADKCTLSDWRWYTSRRACTQAMANAQVRQGMSRQVWPSGPARARRYMEGRSGRCVNEGACEGGVTSQPPPARKERAGRRRFMQPRRGRLSGPHGHDFTQPWASAALGTASLMGPHRERTMRELHRLCGPLRRTCTFKISILIGSRVPCHSGIRQCGALDRPSRTIIVGSKRRRPTHRRGRPAPHAGVRRMPTIPVRRRLASRSLSRQPC